MPCYHPLEAWQRSDGQVVFCERGDILRPLLLPCRRCIGCRLEYSRQWAVRIECERQMHKDSAFVTLTYDDEHLGFPSLRYRDFQLFCKRLRYAKGPFRFYMCGEYGELYKRPHFHACLFGVFFEDRVKYKKLESGFQLWTSEELRKLWGNGHVSIGDVSFESAAYCSRYVTKKVYGNGAAIHYSSFPDFSSGELIQVVPEFSRCSLKPGIGATWLSKFESDVYPDGKIVARGGFKSNSPRYFDALYRRVNPLAADDLEFRRIQESAAFLDDTTPDRLAVREVVATAKAKFKQRGDL